MRSPPPLSSGDGFPDVTFHNLAGSIVGPALLCHSALPRFAPGEIHGIGDIRGLVPPPPLSVSLSPSLALALGGQQWGASRSLPREVID